MQPIRNNILRISLILMLVLGLAAGTATTALAVEFIGGNTIEAGQVIDDDVFISGETVTVDGTVNGDLFATGATVILNGTVKGSLVTSGQTILLNGTVEGSVYAAASNMEVGENASVGRNLYYGGFALMTTPGSMVGRDLLVGGYQFQHGGEVSRDLKAGLAALELDGKVGGDVTLDIAGPGRNAGWESFATPPGVAQILDPGLKVSDGAEIGGEMRYTSDVDQASAIQAAPAGGVVYQTPPPGQRTSPTAPVRVEVRIFEWIFGRFRELATLLALGGLAIWLLPALLNRWAERARVQFGPSAGHGLLVVILGYAGALVAGIMILALGIFFGVITLGGLAQTTFGVGFSSLSLVFTVFTLLVSYGSKLVVSYLAGKLVLARLAPQVAENRVWVMVVGVVIYVILHSIPILGWLVSLGATLVGLGAMWLVFREEGQPALPRMQAA